MIDEKALAKHRAWEAPPMDGSFEEQETEDNILRARRGQAAVSAWRGSSGLSEWTFPSDRGIFTDVITDLLHAAFVEGVFTARYTVEDLLEEAVRTLDLELVEPRAVRAVRR